MQQGQGDHKRLRAFEDIFARPNAARGPQPGPYQQPGYPSQPPQIQYSDGYYNQQPATQTANQMHAQMQAQMQWRAQQEAYQQQQHQQMQQQQLQQQRMSMYSQYEDYPTQIGPPRQTPAGPSHIFPQNTVQRANSFILPSPTPDYENTERLPMNAQNNNRVSLPHRRTTGAGNSIDSSLMSDPHLSAYFDNIHANRQRLPLSDGYDQRPSEDYVVPSPTYEASRPESVRSGNSGGPSWRDFAQPHTGITESDPYYAVRPPDGPRPLPPPPARNSASPAMPNASMRPPSQDSARHSLDGPLKPTLTPTDRSNSFTSTASPVLMSHNRRQSFPANMTLTPVPSYHSQQSHHRTQSGTVVPLPRGNSGQSVQNSTSAVMTASRRMPIVYPALLSKVAEAFKARVLLSERGKDGLSYKDTFDGREAVDKIAYIIKTTDRNLALLLGRALDAQKFFHDVTWEHRLRDSPHELYQFRERLTFVSSDDLGEDGQSQDAHSGRPELPASGPSSELGASTFGGASGFTELDRQISSKSMATTATSQYSELTPDGYIPPEHYKRRSNGRPASITDTILSDDSSVPSGIFTLLTDCYSPTCTRDRLCYSIACPRRLEQQARLKLKPAPGLKRATSTESLGDLAEPGTLWVHSVPQDVLDSTSDAEKRRQEAINEAIYTERDFLRDVEYLREKWIGGIRAGSFIPEARKEDFIQQVFWNVADIEQVSHRLCEQLTRRQKQSHIISQIGDIYLDNVANFGPFVQYGAHQLYGKYEFEKEKGSNPGFAKFVDDIERLPESRKLELNAYLTKPTTRLARYPLLLEVVLKNTPEGQPDRVLIPKAIKIIREFLTKVNAESGKSENRFNLAQLDTQIVFKPGEQVDLKLREESRELITKGPLKKRGGNQSESAELQVFLFDHALVMTKAKNKLEQYKVYRKPIPLELLIVSTIDELPGRGTVTTKSRALMARTSTGGKIPPLPAAITTSKAGFAMTFTHLGRRGYDIVVWASTWIGRKNWLDKIEARQVELRERSMVFDTAVLSEEYFLGANRVTCAAPFDTGNRMVYGTDQGVFIADLRDRKRVPIKVISVANVTQVDVLDDHGILIVLADKAVQTFFIDSLDPSDAVGAAKRARKISSNASFFKTGICMGRTLVCVVKSGSVSSTIKTLEPIEQTRGKKQPAIRKLLQGSHDSLRVFKEFYLPSSADSVHFLKSKLCVGCSKGFEIVDLDTLDTQGLLDPADSSLDFVQKRENVRPIAIYRIEGEFLLCYDDFAFYVNKNGWRTKGNWLVQWEGRPTSFALYYPYVLAFEPTFIEVRQVESGALMQIIPGNSIRCLYSDVSSSATTSNPQPGYYPQTNAPPQFGRHSTYGSQIPLNFRMPPRASQIVFADNGHQVFKMLSSVPPPFPQ